ncbi:MAG TPA: PEP-CTERM sorting domain-containing protein [Gemmatimonadales bacterium]|nr:PEP-CTERM sorting domain-containing protein [Gemmatimonadales bacterium]
MKHVIRGIGAAAALLGAVAGNAWAISPGTYNVCGGDNFETCATVTIGFDGTTNTLTVDIANTSTNGDYFTAFGFRDLASGVSATGVDGGFTGWTFVDGGPTDIQASAGWQAANGNPAVQGIGNDGNSYHFTLTFDGDPALAGATFALHSQAGPNGCSTKLFIDPNGGVNTIDAPSAECGGTTTVPEPITMSLLATGLAGMGGAGLIRRRNKKA